jgi:hypothetical protein
MSRFVLNPLAPSPQRQVIDTIVDGLPSARILFISRYAQDGSTVVEYDLSDELFAQIKELALTTPAVGSGQVLEAHGIDYQKIMIPACCDQAPTLAIKTRLYVEL